MEVRSLESYSEAKEKSENYKIDVLRMKIIQYGFERVIRMLLETTATSDEDFPQ